VQRQSLKHENEETEWMVDMYERTEQEQYNRAHSGQDMTSNRGQQTHRGRDEGRDEGARDRITSPTNIHTITPTHIK